MSTLNQVLKNSRKTSINKIKNFPQKKGICLKIFILNPKKPNSAERKVCKVKLISTKKIVISYIPGEGHSLQEHSIVLIQGAKVKDLPGVNYSCIRGAYDFKH